MGKRLLESEIQALDINVEGFVEQLLAAVARRSELVLDSATER
jgi:hypothetical protein